MKRVNRALRRLAPLLVALAVLLGPLTRPAPSQAAPPDERRALMQQASQQRKAGNDLEALALYKRAHALAATPESFAQLGTTEFSLNRFLDAEVHLTEALRAGQDPW